MSTLYNKIWGGEIHPIGIQSIDCYLSLLIYQVNSDTCTSAFQLNNAIINIKETTIHYTKSGRPYIIRYQKVYYLDEIMRV